jgi:hypothetical protein
VDAPQGAATVGRPGFADGLLELNRWKNARSLSTNGIKGPRTDDQGFENGRRHLGSAHCGAYRLGFEPRMGQQQNDIRVVMGDPPWSASFLVLPE